MKGTDNGESCENQETTTSGSEEKDRGTYHQPISIDGSESDEKQNDVECDEEKEENCLMDEEVQKQIDSIAYSGCTNVKVLHRKNVV